MADTPAETPKRRRTAKTAAAKTLASNSTPAGEAKTVAAKTLASKEAPAPKTRTPSPRKPRTTAAKPAAARPKPAARRAPRKPAPPKPAASAPKEARSIPAIVERAREALPDVQPRTGVFAALGTLAVVGGAFFMWRASKAEEPNFQTIESDGAFEIRKYPARVTAGTEHRGQRKAALNEGFRALADYIFAKSRKGEKLPMTAPVLSDSDGDGSWRTRFIMPTGKARGELPAPPSGVELTVEPAARVAAVRFSGRADEKTLDTKEGALRSWLQLKSLPSEGKAVHAYYNAPFLPSPLRRNEVLIVLSDEGGGGGA